MMRLHMYMVHCIPEHISSSTDSLVLDFSQHIRGCQVTSQGHIPLEQLQTFPVFANSLPST